MTPDVSVIVPVYKVEKYLNRCVDSLVGQTYSNIEITLVDDGSPDSSAPICDESAMRDERITVIHQQNGGLSAARNTGTDIVDGEYVVYLDSDDWSEPQMIQSLYECVSVCSADVGVCGYFTDYESLHTTKTLFVCEQEEHFSDDTIPTAIYRLQTDGGFDVVWNKIYRRSLLVENCIRFEPGGMPMEDFLFNCAVFSEAHGLALVPGAWQHYIRQDGGTLVSKYYPHLYEKTAEKGRTLKKLFLKRKMWDTDFREGYARCYIFAMFACVPNLYRKANIPFSEKLNTFRSMCRDSELTECLRRWTPSGAFMKLYCQLLKFRSPIIMACVFGVLFFIRNHCGTLYKSIFSTLLKRGKA